MMRTMKKSVTMMLAMLVLVFALAVPAFADATNYRFLDADGVYSSHASAFTYDAVKVGTTVTLKYSSAVVTDLKVWNGSSYTDLTGVVSGGFIEFTFTVADYTTDIPVLLEISAGPHSGDMELIIDWL
ncbi:hypothetical protein [Paenibacillus agricola]|uniref:NEAT domain-containing protein n=1 Tax=Paenibacillus agricola TaxID=2716264 RepID=A0ABX0IYY0_9BACL|nr:hypothetical protein [Paenibacillus agricola]NHN29174.1 hypothetical protein [Paenibacillus agricola]